MVASRKGGIMSKEIAVRNDLGLMGTSDAFFQSGYFPDVKSAAQAAIKIMAGQEIGVGPFASMRGIVVNHGKLELSAGLVGSLIKQSGVYDYRIVTHTNEQCILTFYEQGNDVGKSGFTIEDAQKAGLTTGTNAHSWSHYPRNMLFSRALTNGARWYCPDIFSGSIYTPDEMGTPIDGETGEVVEAEIIEQPKSTEPMPRPHEDPPRADGWDDDDPDMPEAPPEPSPIAEPKHHAKWGTYWKRGKALGITGPVMDTIAGGITIAALTVRADALKEAIAQREADLAAAKD